MSHKSKSINNSRCEAKRIYNQRRYIKKLEEKINVIEVENKKLKKDNKTLIDFCITSACSYILAKSLLKQKQIKE